MNDQTDKEKTQNVNLTLNREPFKVITLTACLVFKMAYFLIPDAILLESGPFLRISTRV